MMSPVLTVLLLATVAPVRAAIVNGTVVLKELARRPIANAQMVDSARTCGPWVRTLSDQAVLHRDQGQVEEARKTLAEELQLLRELAEIDPETYQPELAETLNKVGLFD